MTKPNLEQCRSGLLRLCRVCAPCFIAIGITAAAHAQGSIDMSGATNVMNTFKTFALYAEAVMETTTLQAHLAKGQQADTGEKKLYVLDESSLASTKQMHDFVSRLHPNDRVLLVGDTQQHEAVEAGRPFAQLQDAGMRTVKLDEIVRQRDPELKNVVEQLACGQVGEAIGGLERQGRVHEVKDSAERIEAIAQVRADGSEQTYDPRRQQGVSIYRGQEKAFSVGDRIQFTAPANDLKVANRELGNIQSFTDDGRMSLKMDAGRGVSIDPREHPHLDHGYAVTSHSSQGQTADRVLINIDTELGAKDLINNRMAYVSVSRGAYDAQIFTSDREKLPQVFSRDVSHRSAHVPEMAEMPKQEITPPRHRLRRSSSRALITGSVSGL